MIKLPKSTAYIDYIQSVIHYKHTRKNWDITKGYLGLPSTDICKSQESNFDILYIHTYIKNTYEIEQVKVESI